MSTPLTLNKTPPKADGASPAPGRRALVRTASGEMVHLYTSARVTTTPQLMVIDEFAQTQLDAGKWIEEKL